MDVGLSNRMAKEWLGEFARASSSLGMTHRIINIGADDWLDQLRGVDLFVWRLIMSDPSCMAEARTKIPLLEATGIRCFPSAHMLWLYDDKIRETFFLRQHNHPTPRTWVYFDEAGARAFVEQAVYPLVAKAHCGAGSGGVVLIRSAAEARALVGRMFRKPSLWAELVENYYTIPRLAKGDMVVQLKARYRDAWPQYVYFQEFLITDRDWRITTLGHDLVSVFSRRNRPDDFRASGSGIWEKVTVADLPVEACQQALAISNQHGFTSMTYDFMKGPGGWVIGEISYAFMLNAVYSDTLFRREGSTYVKAEAVAIGEMHLRAMLEQTTGVGHGR